MSQTSKSSASGMLPISSTDASEPRLSSTLIRKLSTQWNLPPGWEHYFSVRGNGQEITCPYCPNRWRPGKDVAPHRRWKVLANHMAVAHPVVATKEPARMQRAKPARLLRVK